MTFDLKQDTYILNPSNSGGSEITPILPSLRPLWEHQKKAVELIIKEDRKYYGLFFEQGTGKSLTAVEILRNLYYKQGSIIPTLILAPIIVLENWRREILQSSKIESERIACLSGTGDKRLKTFLAYKERTNGKFICIVNYESLLIEKLFNSLLLWQPQCIIFDESHKCKDHSAKRTKAAQKLAYGAEKMRLLLTGTPVLNSSMDIFSQFRLMDFGKEFGESFFQFRARYFWDKNASMPQFKHFPDWRPRPGSMEEMAEKISKSSMSVKKKDCLDLPPLVRQKIFVEMAADQKKAYEEMKKDFITFVDSKACTAQLAMTKALRLQQIVSGFVPVKGETEDEIKRFKDNPRKKALKELLEDLAFDHKIIIWAVWRANYVDIRDVLQDLKIEFVECHGEISYREKMDAVKRFNEENKIRAFLGHPGSGGIGCNLTASDLSIWYSRAFSLEFELQAEARNYRGGSEIHEKITRIDLLCADTIDELVLEALSNKQEISARLIMNERDRI